VVISLERGADCLHMVQLMPLHPKTASSLASFKSRLVLPFWYRLTQAVLGKRPLNGVVVVLYMGHDHSLPGIECQGHGSRSKVICLTVCVCACAIRIFIAASYEY